MTLAADRVIVAECVSLARIGIAVSALENRHGVVEAAVIEAEDSRDTGRIVGSIVLELSCTEGLLKCKLLVHKLVDSVGLVAVCNDELAAEHSHGSIDNEVGIGELARIERLSTDSVTVLNENAVSAVLASSHDEVSRNSVLSV